MRPAGADEENALEAFISNCGAESLNFRNRPTHGIGGT
jgi:hypothetical protein